MKLVLLLVELILPIVLFAQAADRHQVLITEIFPDPSPVVGLPNAEFLELTNVSKQPFNLDKWRITDGNSTAVITGGFILQPDSQVIICSKAYVQDFVVFGNTIGVSAFPSLDNSGDLIVLLSPEGKTIHAVEYNLSWYRNELKQEGGWSLEICDIRMPCVEKNNWRASEAVKGGTPGKKNSISETISDTISPLLLRTFAIDSLTVVAVFNKGLDSTISAIPLRYELNAGIGVPSLAIPQPPLFRQVILTLQKPLHSAQVYTLLAREIRDCSGNTAPLAQEVKAGLASPPAEGQVRINEILFDPAPGGVDYAELFNRGPGIVDMQNIYMGNRNNGLAGSLVKCSEIPWFLFPGEYIALTENSDIVQREYASARKDRILEVKSMPSLPDDKGTCIILNAQGRELDQFSYLDDYHFPLLSAKEGVSLERIDPSANTQDPANWHSAATDAGKGTPGYRNSQYRQDAISSGEIDISPSTFSPDLDGRDDLLMIRYQFPAPGYTCSIIIYDHTGRPVRYLVRNNLCGLQGFFQWNGLDEKAMRLPAGIYYLVTEIITMDGKRKLYRKAVVLAYRLK